MEEMSVMRGAVAANSDLANMVLHGQVQGSAFVSEGVAEVNGMVCGDLVVAEGATASVNGTITGDLTVLGTAVVMGTVNGVARVLNGGSLRVTDDAICRVEG